MTRTAITGIAPFFIVRNVPAALSFYRDRLGFDITFQGPDPDDIFFGIIQRGAAMIMLKNVGVDPLPNCTRDVKKGLARWDAYLHVPDPDALAAEFASRNVEFSEPLKDDDDGLRGFELEDTDGYVLFFGRPVHTPSSRVIDTFVVSQANAELSPGLWAVLEDSEKLPAPGSTVEIVRPDGTRVRAQVAQSVVRHGAAAIQLLNIRQDDVPRLSRIE
ncbi:MAG TPA: VOC family protein [Thermoanaerobaculia bacterium]|nr:VOC family protein [Thermoanaerobaculia bacterium]